MKFRKKPVVIDAVEGAAFIRWGDIGRWDELPEWVKEAYVGRKLWWIYDTLYAQTLEGEMRAYKESWIIKGVKGEIYFCAPDVFEMTYEPVTETP